MTEDEKIIQEATEAVTKGIPCAFYVPLLLDVINRQKAEIVNRTEEYNDMLEQRNKVEEALEIMTMDVNSLTSERDALQEMVAEQKAEIERLRYILVNFMGEIFDWGNKNGVDTRIFAQTAILGKEKDGAVKQIKSEAYREFAEKVKAKADRGFWQEHSYVDTEDIDNTLKELTEK